jgi:IS5 family transposase
MYEEKDKRPKFETFYLPFGGHLDGSNRWVQLESIIPWEAVEEHYKNHFKKHKGRKAKNVRLALGALIIKEKLRLTDEETVEQIRENPYLQFFLGFEGYEYKRPFEASMMVFFRRRLGAEAIQDINEIVAIKHHEEATPKPKGKDKGDDDDGQNHGQLLLDATCAPQDIRHPHDVTLLSESREKLEAIIDRLYEQGLLGKKPRTYRKLARCQYLEFIRGRRRNKKEIRRSLRKQLGYVRRDLGYLQSIEKGKGFEGLEPRQRRAYETIKEIYRQQKYLYDNKTHSIPHKIVSISQSHVRPIARGKAARPFEFGAKLSVSVTEKRMIFIDRLDWEPFNECHDLPMQVERYKKRFGHYPESVHADKIYRTRENREYCEERGIRLSGPPLGRPLARTEENKQVLRALRRVMRRDDAIRQEVESVFGVGKRRYGLDKIYEKTKETSEVSINVCILLMNLEKILRDLFLRFKEGLVFLFRKIQRYWGLQETGRFCGIPLAY